MKQLVIIEVQNCDDKQRSIAMKIVVGIRGVESVAVQGANKNHIAVVGNGVDSVDMMNSLRKKIKQVKLVRVTPVDHGYLSDDTFVTAPDAHDPTYHHRPSYQAIVPYGVYGHRSSHFDNTRRHRPTYYDNYGYKSHAPARV